MTEEMIDLPARGSQMAVRRWPDAQGQEQIVFLHANGLNALAYRILFEAMAEHDRRAGDEPMGILAADQRGHGRTTLPADPAFLHDWHVYAEDAEAMLQTRQAPPGGWVLVGHSMGAVTSLLVAARGAIPVHKIVLIEPVIVPAFTPLLARSPFKGVLERMIPVARKAAARRARFASREAAREAYADKRFFADWADGVLDDYLADGLRPYGEGVRLACAPAWEAATFTAQGHSFWKALRGARRAAGKEIYAIYADQGSTALPAGRRRLKAMEVEAVTMTGTSHLLTQEKPEDVAFMLRDAIRFGFDVTKGRMGE